MYTFTILANYNKRRNMTIFSRSQRAPTEEELLLQKMGLNKQEALIYVTLLSEPDLTVGEISRASTLHRPTIYRTIPSLIGKGLISKEFRGKRTCYKAESPSKLRPVFEQMRDDIENSLPELEKKYRGKQERPGIKMVEGKRAIPFLLLDVIYTLNRGDAYYRYSSAKPSVLHNQSNLPRNYKKIRDEKEISRFVITTKAIEHLKTQK